MTRAIAWTVRVAPVLAVALLAPSAHAQGLQPPPPMGAPAAAPAGYPPGYPGAPVQPGQPGPVGQPGQPGQVGQYDIPPEESQDSGLGLEWVWLNADAGYAYTDLASFSQSSLGLQKTASSGPVVGAGIGARLLFFTFGVRARDLILDNIGNLWEIGAEAAFHLRVWHIDPYFGVRGGYNFVGSLNKSTVSVAAGDNPSSVSVHGFDVGPMVGIDFYLAKYVSIGIDAELQFLFLERPKVPLPAGLPESDVTSLPEQEQQLYNESGNSAGFAFVPTAHLGIHF